MHFVGMPSNGLYRAGRWADVDRFPEPAQRIALSAALTDGYRWEDPQGEFATAKCSASEEAAIGRTIARYRRREVEPGEGIIDAIKGFMSNEADYAGEPELEDGRVPEDVFDDLYSIHIPGDRNVVFVDLDHDDTYADLEAALGPALAAMGVGPLSRNLAREEDRRITRLALRALHSSCADGRFGPVAGVRYPGQPDAEWEAFVLWSPPELVSLTAEDINLRWVASWDEEALAAAKRLGLILPPQRD